MLGSLKPVVLGLLLVASSAFAASSGQCKAGCKNILYPGCEKACREHAKRALDACLKEGCEAGLKRCEKTCEAPPKRK